MRYSTGLVFAAALSVSEVLASPTHAHLHKHAHAKKDVDYNALDWNAMGIDWTSAWAAGQKTKTTAAPAATATPTTQAAVFIEAVKTSASKTSAAAATSAAAKTSDAVDSIVSSVDAAWASIKAASNSLSAFGQSTPGKNDPKGWGYIANVGEPEGSNMIKVASTSGYDFTNTFINTSGGKVTVAVWNMAASPGLTNSSLAVANLGACQASKYAALTFTLSPGGRQSVAFMDNTVIGWAQPTSELNTASQFKTAWGEAKFNSTGSGYDVTFIPSDGQKNYKMSISSGQVSCVSDNDQNYWLTDTQPIGNSDGSCYVPGSSMHLTTNMGGAI
jgi:hypothetical protein